MGAFLATCYISAGYIIIIGQICTESRKDVAEIEQEDCWKPLGAALIRIVCVMAVCVT